MVWSNGLKSRDGEQKKTFIFLQPWDYFDMIKIAFVAVSV